MTKASKSPLTSNQSPDKARPSKGIRKGKGKKDAKLPKTVSEKATSQFRAWQQGWKLPKWTGTSLICNAKNGGLIKGYLCFHASRDRLRVFVAGGGKNLDKKLAFNFDSTQSRDLLDQLKQGLTPQSAGARPILLCDVEIDGLDGTVASIGQYRFTLFLKGEHTMLVKVLQNTPDPTEIIAFETVAKSEDFLSQLNWL